MTLSTASRKVSAKHPISKNSEMDSRQPALWPFNLVLFEEALEQAAALDREFELTGRVRPLHGVPFTAKDTCTLLGPT